MAIYVTQAKRVTDEMFIEAGQAVADQVPGDFSNKACSTRYSRTFSKPRFRLPRE
jgi:malic enzyme